MSITLPRYVLADNDIHLWMVNPQQIAAAPALRELLSQAEQDKVDRYRFPEAQHNALITRAFIRLILSQYLPNDPQHWQFSVSPLGKPELSNGVLPLRFNLSHNNEMLICALCLDNDIGCDVENMGRKISVNAIAKRFFSAQEAQRIQAKPQQFFAYWTLKEAFVKATGLGISQGLDTFSFRIDGELDTTFDDQISLTFKADCQQQDSADWYQALLFPDSQHCIGLAVNRQTHSKHKPAIRLFDSAQGAALFSR